MCGRTNHKNIYFLQEIVFSKIQKFDSVRQTKYASKMLFYLPVKKFYGCIFFFSNNKVRTSVGWFFFWQWSDHCISSDKIEFSRFHIWKVKKMYIFYVSTILTNWTSRMSVEVTTDDSQQTQFSGLNDTWYFTSRTNFIFLARNV